MREIACDDMAKLLATTFHRPLLELTYVSYDGAEQDDECAELMKAAPYLSQHGAFLLMSQHFLWVLFDDYDEMLRSYEETVGDDGPTETNDYDGPARVYACTFTAEGVAEFENT